MAKQASDDAYTEMRKQWLNRYLRVQAGADKELKAVLLRSAEDAYSELMSLSSKRTFSVSVKSAQIRLLMQVLNEVLRGLFNEELRIIEAGNEQAAVAAVTAFTETDRNFLRAALRNSEIGLEDFINAQKKSAMLGVAHAVQNQTKANRPLSSRVYSTRSLANRWVKQKVTSGIMRGSSAQEIATEVRRFIKPGTPGGVSYAAMRLARTEINNAFHSTSISLAEDRPWVQEMRWRLSATHRVVERNKCQCERYADEIFSVASVPPKPHPQCRCFVTPEVEAYDSFLENLTNGQYSDWIRNAA